MNARYPCALALLVSLALAAPASAQLFGLPGNPCETGFVDCGTDPQVNPNYDPDYAPEPDPDLYHESWEACVAAGDCDEEDVPYHHDTWEACVAAGDCEPLTPEQEACAQSPTCGLPEDSLHWDEEAEAYYVPELKLFFDPDSGQWFEPGTGRILSAKEAKEAARKVKDKAKIQKILRSTAGGPVGIVLGAIRSLF